MICWLLKRLCVILILNISNKSPWPPNIWDILGNTSRIELNLTTRAPLNITAKEAKNETNLIPPYTFGLLILGLLLSPLTAWGDKQRDKPLTLNLLPCLAGALQKRLTLALRLVPLCITRQRYYFFFTVFRVCLYRDRDKVHIHYDWLETWRRYSQCNLTKTWHKLLNSASLIFFRGKKTCFICKYFQKKLPDVIFNQPVIVL